MSTSTPSRLKNIKGGAWRIELRSRDTALRSYLDSPSAMFDSGHRDKAIDHLGAVDALVDDRQTLLEWWFGSQVECAWTEMRQAEHESYLAENDQRGVVTNAVEVLASAKGRVPDTEQVVRDLTTAIAALAPSNGSNPTATQGSAPPPGPTPPTSPSLATVKQQTVELAKRYVRVSDVEHQAQRATRNIVLVLCVALTVAAVVVAVLGLRNDVFAGLIAVPKGLTPGREITLAFVLGAMGALFTAIPSLATAPSNTTTYSPKVLQSVLKIVVGAWSALVGLIAVAASAPPAAAEAQAAAANAAAATPSAQTLAGFALLCLGFGATQEALTRFIDRQAKETTPATSTTSS